MFGMRKKEKALYAVCTGRSVELARVPDEAFAGGMLGVGFGVEPSVGEICSPADGRIESVAETSHAYTILTDDGLDVLVHIGVDTVGLHGEGFEALVKAGDRVRVGDKLARVDLDFIKGRGLPTVTAVLVTDPEKITDISFRFGAAVAGMDAVMHYRAAGKG